jgi:hypothetical protein
MNYSTTELQQFDVELVKGAVLGTLTEQRYNELLDILLPTATFPETRASMLHCGELEWIERRNQRNVAA